MKSMKYVGADGAIWTHEDEFMNHIGSRSEKTANTYRTALRALADWLQNNGKADFDSQRLPFDADGLTTDLLLEWHHALSRSLSQSTVRTYRAGVISFLTHLEFTERLTSKVNITKLRRLMTWQQPTMNKSRNIAILDDARKNGIPLILAYWDGKDATDTAYNRHLSVLRNRALLWTLYATACRANEALGLDRADVANGQAKHTHIIGKGGYGRTIHIRDYAREHINAYLAVRGKDGHRPLFISHARNSNGKRMSDVMLHSIIKEAVDAMDLHPSLSAHDFRHYRATQLLRKKVPLEVVQEYLGHASIDTTRRIYAPLLGVDIVSDWLDKLES